MAPFVFLHIYTNIGFNNVVLLVNHVTPQCSDDATRVKLLEGPDYINANYVNVSINNDNLFSTVYTVAR